MKKFLVVAAVSVVTIYLGLGSLPMEHKVPMLVALSVLLMGTLRQLRSH